MGVTRLETAKNSVDARCMRLLVAVRLRPSHTRSACSWRCPTTHVLLAPPRAHTQCLPTVWGHFTWAVYYGSFRPLRYDIIIILAGMGLLTAVSQVGLMG